MQRCTLCPRKCGIDRSSVAGPCRCLDEMSVAAVVVHRGEEPPLVGGAGSGAVFFSGCTLMCSFCQNKDISRSRTGTVLSVDELARYMLELRDKGCSNINLVTPMHFSPRVIGAIEAARSSGLDIPVMVNSGGYESVSTLSMWEGYANIYLMDLKYGDNAAGGLLSGVNDYWDVARAAVEKAYDMVGPLEVSSDGKAIRGLMVRHLVLPGMLSNPFAVLEYMAEVSTRIPLSIMSQYNPVFYDGDIEEMKRGISAGEYDAVVEKALSLGFETLFVQEMDASSSYMPRFGEEEPFGEFENLLRNREKGDI